MIYRHLVKKQKAIAWVLFLLFYSEMIAGVKAASLAYKNNNFNIAYTTNNNISRVSAVGSESINDIVSIKPVESDHALVREPYQPGNAKNLISVQKTQTGEGGPSQPEMATFKSVGVDQMVNSFTGDFSYNIPLLDVGGYPVNIFYNAGISMEQEASWVGLGWNINPGTISRNMRGLPDDFNGDGGDIVTKEQSIAEDKSLGVTLSKGYELVGMPKNVAGSANLSLGVKFNSKLGLSLSAGGGAEFKMHKELANDSKDDKTKKISPELVASTSVNVDSRDGVTVGLGFHGNLFSQDSKTAQGLSTSIEYNSLRGLSALKIDYDFRKMIGESKSHDYGIIDNSLSFASPSYTPSIRMVTTNSTWMLGIKLGKENKPAFKNWGLQGFYSVGKIADADKKSVKKAYGFMYMDRVFHNASGAVNDDALMDFNRLNDRVYTKKTPIISVPVLTHDVFSISGEGTGGSFRGYRGNVGYVKDNKVTSKSNSAGVSFDVGLKDKVHVGAVLNGAFTSTTAGEWKLSNALKENLQYEKSYADYEGFYFKNPDEKAIIDEDFYNAVGGDKLIRPTLVPDGGGTIYTPTALLQSKYEVFNESLAKESDLPVAGALRKSAINRDKRTQLISFLTAGEASIAEVGLDNFIWDYQENVFKPGSCVDPVYKRALSRIPESTPKVQPGITKPLSWFKKSHHISEVTVLEGDSKRYIYGLPVYTHKQTEVAFSVKKTQTGDSKNEVTVDGDQDTINNDEGPEKFFQSESVGAFASSFLLTGILSPDYVDIKGDGITDDDLGNAIKFNYSFANRTSANSYSPYNWRYPFTNNEKKAAFNDGLKTDHTDNKASYSYGEKELWYLHSIESKNMVVTFKVSKREDGWGIDKVTGNLSNSICQRKLDRIDLYTKADFVKYHQDPVHHKLRPVKSVFFEYDYVLCPNYPFNGGRSIDKNGNAVGDPGSALNVNKNKGKLTLKSIWFTYNGSNKKSGHYKFAYGTTKNGININPAYNTTEIDRWGGYKASAYNPNNPSTDPATPLRNADYSYASQDVARANAFASAWNLEKILLPSGAVITVDYEADSYSYVQDRRATVATPLLGFGRSATSVPSNKIYGSDGLLASEIAGNAAKMDYQYVFFPLKTASASITKKELYHDYLKGIKQLLMKLWVKVKADKRGEGYEPIFVYASISGEESGDWYGLMPVETSGPNSGKHTGFYVKMNATQQSGSPVVQTVFDFVRRNLPSKVYPGYDLKGDGVAALGRAVWGMFDQILKASIGFEASLKVGKHFNTVSLTASMGRLNAPLAENTKLGGGHRVKSITIKDNWDELTKLPDNTKPEKASEYGQLYEYTIEEDGKLKSSGVSTYEPGAGNEENPFREVYQWKEKQPLGPTQYENIELPVAEQLFPSPQVGYSRTTVKSIHNRATKNIKSGVGKQVSEFYTSRDFPVITDFTAFDEASRKPYTPSPLATIMQLKQMDLLTLTQGFRVILNDMNGKPKANYSYPEGDDRTIVNSTRYFYRSTKVGENKYKLNNIVPVISNAKGVVVNKMIGKEVELMNDSRDHYTYTYAGQVPVNADIFTAGGWPVILPSIFRMAFKDESLFRSFATLKVVHEYGILEKIENNDKGSIVNTENMVYDGETGEVLVSKTNNEFKKPVYNVNYPGHWFETGMEPAYKNIDVSYDHVTFRKGRLEGVPQSVFDLFESGDELFVTSSKAPTAGGCAANPNEDCNGLPLSAARRIWALDLRKDPNNPQGTKDFIFIDREGNPYNGADASFRIIRSGHRNLGSASLGSAQSQENPIVNGELKVNNDAKIINAGAALFKERWKVNDQFYTEKEWTTSQTYAELKTLVLTPQRHHVTTKSYGQKDPNLLRVQDDEGIGYITSALRSGPIPSETGLFNSDTRSWMEFDLSGLPITSTITGASLILQPHGASPGHLDYNNHNYPNPHVKHSWDNASTFRLFIDRMRSPWPGSGSPQLNWRNIIFDQFGTGAESLVTVNPEQNGSWAPDYFSNASYNVPVTQLVRAMSLNRNTQATAFGFRVSSRADINKWNSRMCFSTYSPPPSGDVIPLQTALVITYYNCSQPYTGSGAKRECSSTGVYNTVCKSVYTKNFVNPYVQGLLGNWRPWRSYVFYGERRETLGNPTNISTDGVIKDFEPYWILPASTTAKMSPAIVDIPQNTISKWVWNSEVQLYNRKGAQLQDHDPLDRFNAAIYGYQETLPLATVSNSKLRESAFDGFEDYGYKDDICEPICKPARRHFETAVTESMLDDKESHTGRYSLKITGGSSYNFNLPVLADENSYTPQINITANKTVNGVQSYTLAGLGSQLQKDYDNCLASPSDHSVIRNLYHYDDRWENNERDYFYRAYGKIIVDKSGLYQFNMNTGNDYAAFYLNGSPVPLVSRQQWGPNCSGWPWAGPAVASVSLTAGQVYTYKIDARKRRKGAFEFQLLWKKPCDDNFSNVSVPNLYMPNQVAPGAVTVNYTCYAPSQIKPAQSAVIGGFALIPGKKMIAGIWIKKGGQDCKCDNYTGINPQIKNNGNVVASLLPTSKIIEGWQLFEAEFTVPMGTAELVLSVQTSGTDPFYLDDMRMHPFNGNMKSFVYDPKTLWLTGELDENNYASFYEYDDEGTLIRVKKETREGVKTIKETRSAVQGKIENF